MFWEGNGILGNSGVNYDQYRLEMDAQRAGMYKSAVLALKQGDNPQQTDEVINPLLLLLLEE